MIIKITLTIFFSLLIAFFAYLHIFFALGVVLFLFVVFLALKNPEKILITACALFPFNNMVIFRFLSMDIRVIELIFISSVIFIMLRLWISSSTKFSYHICRTDVIFFVFLILSLSGVIYSRFPLVVIKETVQLLYLFLLFRVTDHLFIKEENRSRFLKITFWSAAVFCFFGYVSIILKEFPLPQIYIINGFFYPILSGLATQVTEKSSLSILRATSFHWGYVATANILIILYYLVLSRKAELKKYILLFFIVVFLLLTGSRAAFFVFLMLFIFKSFIERRNAILILSMLILLLTPVLSLPALRERMLESFSTTEISTRSHFAVWSSAIEIFKANPLFGIGSGGFSQSYESFGYFKSFGLKYLPKQAAAHNFILQILAENGVIGLILMLSFIWLLLIPITRLLHRNELLRNVFLAFVGTLLMNLTMNAFSFDHFWIMLGLLIGIGKSVTETEHSTSKNIN